MKTLFYVLLCLLGPPLWGLISYFIFGSIQKRLPGGEGE